MHNTIAKWSSAVAAGLALLVPLVGGAIAPGYSQAANYISELGERGTTLGDFVSYAGFLPVGLAALLALICSFRLEANRYLRSSIVWMFTLPISYLTAAFARCTAGCAGLDGAQALHNLAGVAEYLGGSIALAIAGSVLLGQRRIALGAAWWIAGIGVLVCFLAMLAPQYYEHRGSIQRLAEAALFGFLLFLVWQRRKGVLTP